MSKRLICSLFLFLSMAIVLAAQPGELSFDIYNTPKDVNAYLKSWNSKYPQLTKLINIGKSSGKNDLFIFRIAAGGKGSPGPDSRPAVFVSANIEGVHPVGTEAALMLIQKLLTKYGSDNKIKSLLDRRTVYVAPLLNPDAAYSFFARIRVERRRNNNPVDDDSDELIDEDGPDDLNRDGLITQMRVKDPEGQMIQDPAEPRLMRKADPKKGEKGIYKVYTEGLDNDMDGNYNEDPPGGAEVNRNFPHDFEYYVKSAGLWPVSQKETIALVKFLVSHPNIAMVLNFSTENTFLNLQQTGRARAAGAKVKVPQRFASFLGLDPDKEYDMQELIDILKGMPIFGGQEIDESLIAMMLGLGPAMSIDKKDSPYIEAVQKDYKDGLKEAKLDYPEKRAKGVGKGSFVAYCYYQYGVQVFSSDLWRIPEPKKEPADKDALTVEKLPPRPAAKEGEHPDSYILKWSDSALQGNGFVDWKPYNHPTLGNVEIGGFIPFLKTTPPPFEIEKAIDFHTDFYIDLMGRLPRLEIKETKVEALEDGLYQVTAYLTNTGWFPTSTAQGVRAGTSWPIRVQLKTSKGQSIFSGRSIVNIPSIGGSGDTKKAEWTIRGGKGSKITITAKTPKLDTVTTTVVLQ